MAPTRRRASVGTFFAPSSARERANNGWVFRFLIYRNLSVGALWLIGALASWLESDTELIGVTAAIGSVFALAEWRAAKQQDGEL